MFLIIFYENRSNKTTCNVNRSKLHIYIYIDKNIRERREISVDDIRSKKICKKKKSTIERFNNYYSEIIILEFHFTFSLIKLSYNNNIGGKIKFK